MNNDNDYYLFVSILLKNVSYFLAMANTFDKLNPSRVLSYSNGE